MKSLSRKYAHRKSLLRNLATSLILYERIQTTTAKAKEVKPIVEQLVNLSKKNAFRHPLVARRRLLGYLFDKNAVKKVFEVLSPRYKNKPSGFLKIYKVSPRLGDAAQMSILEFEKVKEIKEENAPEESKTKTSTKKEASPKTSPKTIKKAAK